MGRLRELCERSRNRILCATTRVSKDWLRQGERNTDLQFVRPAKFYFAELGNSGEDLRWAHRTESRVPHIQRFKKLAEWCRLIHISLEKRIQSRSSRSLRKASSARRRGRHARGPHPGRQAVPYPIRSK